jgi:hypothetical protein
MSTRFEAENPLLQNFLSNQIGSFALASSRQSTTKHLDCQPYNLAWFIMCRDSLSAYPFDYACKLARVCGFEDNAIFLFWHFFCFLKIFWHFLISDIFLLLLALKISLDPPVVQFFALREQAIFFWSVLKFFLMHLIVLCILLLHGGGKNFDVFW